MTFPRTGLRYAIAAAIALSLSLTACAADTEPDATSGEGQTPDASGTAASGPVDGGELVFAIGNDPISLNPTGTGSGNDTLYVTRQLVDSLLYQNPETTELEPWLATEWTGNEDATSFTFTLRDDVTFSDGTPLTANSVKASFDDIIAAGAAATNAASLLAGYQQSTVVDEHTVQVDFSTPNAAFPNSTASVSLGILGEATFTVPFEQRADGEAVVGSGPFTLGSYTKDVETVLTKRDGYAWGPESLGNDGAAHLDSVTFQVVPEASVRTGSLTSGQVDVIGGVQPNDVATVDDGTNRTISRGNPGVTFGLYFNGASPFGSDRALREAISYAVDPQEVRDTSLNELFAVATSSLAATTPGYADVSSIFSFDPDKAAQLLDAAGWTEGADGIRQKDGEQLSLRLAWITNFSPNQTSLEIIQQQLRAVGVDVQLVGGTVPEFTALLASADYDVAWGNQSRADGDVLRTAFSSAGTNNYHIDDAELEALLQQQAATSDPTARNAVLQQVQERIASEYYHVPVHELTSILGAAPRVNDVSLGADSRLDSLVAAWLSE